MVTNLKKLTKNNNKMASGNFKPPKSLVFDNNIRNNFTKFKQSFEIYMIAAGLSNKPDATKIAIFLNVAGEEAIDVFNTLTFQNEEDRTKYESVVEAFTEYCEPHKNETYDRYKLFGRKMKSLPIS